LKTAVSFTIYVPRANDLLEDADNATGKTWHESRYAAIVHENAFTAFITLLAGRKKQYL